MQNYIITLITVIIIVIVIIIIILLILKYNTSNTIITSNKYLYTTILYDNNTTNVIDKWKNITTTTKDDNSITYVRDPRYNNDEKLAELLDGKLNNIKSTEYTHVLSELKLLFFAPLWYSRSPKSSITICDTKKIINFKYNNSSILYNNIRNDTYFKYEILKIISDSIYFNNIKNPDRSLNVFFPSTYDDNSNGGMFVKYDNDETARFLENKLLFNEYQIHATNHLHKMKSGKKTSCRNGTDVVFSYNKIINVTKDVPTNIITSFLDKTYYPIFIHVTEINNIAYVTFTIMTNDLCYYKLFDILNNNKNIENIIKL